MTDAFVLAEHQKRCILQLWCSKSTVFYTIDVTFFFDSAVGWQPSRMGVFHASSNRKKEGVSICFLIFWPLPKNIWMWNSNVKMLKKKKVGSNHKNHKTSSYGLKKMYILKRLNYKSKSGLKNLSNPQTNWQKPTCGDHFSGLSWDHGRNNLSTETTAQLRETGTGGVLMPKQQWETNQCHHQSNDDRIIQTVSKANKFKTSQKCNRINAPDCENILKKINCRQEANNSQLKSNPSEN